MRFEGFVRYSSGVSVSGTTTERRQECGNNNHRRREGEKLDRKELELWSALSG
jgi:hypothetical protein